MTVAQPTASGPLLSITRAALRQPRLEGSGEVDRTWMHLRDGSAGRSLAFLWNGRNMVIGHSHCGQWACEACGKKRLMEVFELIEAGIEEARRLRPDDPQRFLTPTRRSSVVNQTRLVYRCGGLSSALTVSRGDVAL